MDKAHWEDTTWKTIKQKYPKAKVLQPGQDLERSKTWKNLVNVRYLQTNFSEGI